MQREVKIGLILGVVLLAAGVLVWAPQPEPQQAVMYDDFEPFGEETIDPVAPVPMPDLGHLFEPRSTAVIRTVPSAEEQAAEPATSQLASAESPPSSRQESEPEREPSRPAPDQRTYKASSGDTLWSLAERFYGSGSKWRVIADANRDVLPASNHLQQGMELVIPPDPDGAPEQASPRLETAQTEESTRTHVVVPGDSLAGLSQRFYGSVRHWRQLFEANKDRIPNPDVLPVGTELVIPPLS